MEYNEAFFEAMLRNHRADQTIKVLSASAEPATAKGENFLSDMLRISVEFTRGSQESETRSFILKHEPVGDSAVLGMVQAQQLFTVEFRVLRDIVPRIESSLGVRLGPKLVYGTEEPPRAIIMEDLTPEGFCIKNRQHGLSMSHATTAIQNLARFHAGSVALSEENPEALKSFKQGIFNATTHSNFYLLVFNSLNRLCEEATGWLDEELDLAAEKLRGVVQSAEDRLRAVYEYEDNEFCVLNHGDAWINNMLFRDDESGKPIEQVFVDFQMVSFSSPAVDLLYFLSINPSLSIRGKGDELLLEIYLETLTSSMKKLGCKTTPPTMRHLKEAMHRRRIYAVVSGLFLLPRMLLDKEEVEGMEQLLEHGTFKVNPYGNPNTIRMMKRLLPLMSDRGYLEP